jgi:hypothetical protein
MVWGGNRDDNSTNCLYGPCSNDFNLTETNHHFLIENWDRDDESFVEFTISEFEPLTRSAKRLTTYSIVVLISMLFLSSPIDVF